jgi:hypothetical protein
MVDFKDQLGRQIKFLETSCLNYDQGSVEEAVRIAVALRVLFHDSNNSTSLLKHLGANSISLLTTRTHYLEDPVTPNHYLVQLVAQLDMGAENRNPTFKCNCIPRLDTAIRKELITFKVWWEKEYVIKHKQPRTKLTRKHLVLAAANKDGGAHVDKALDPIYDYVRLGSGLELEITLKPELGLPVQKASFKNIHFASLRQIAFEVLNSPAILALKYEPGRAGARERTA